VAKKISRAYDVEEKIYSREQWDRLRDMRGRALGVMDALASRGIESIVHGSLARGDVGPKSDIDIFIPSVVPSYLIEGALASAGFGRWRRELTQATPVHTVKAIIHVDERVKVTFPLLPLRAREREFYAFGGELGREELRAGRRAPGVDKRLKIIVPTDRGHREFSIVENIEEAVRVLGADPEIVRERIRVLMRRDRVGRTGVYYKEEVGEEESFEEKLRERAAQDPSLRRLMQQRGHHP